MLKQKYAKSHCIQTTQPGRVFLNTDSPVKLVSHRYFELNDKFLYINLYAIGSPSPHHLNGVTFCLFSIKYLTFLCLLTLIGSSKWQAIQVLFGLLLYVNFWNKSCKFIFIFVQVRTQHQHSYNVKLCCVAAVAFLHN